MSMSTANRRASAIGIGLAIRLVLPVPDGTIDAADRQQVAYSYAGIHANQPIVAPPELIAMQANIRTEVSTQGNIRRTITASAGIRRRVDIKVER